ncbi:RNA polymerase sigma-70 factor [Sciscionella sediminilitoris]|uniref:RNA polymerase sigma-70 factor n=1 Tax=Sciscionella sediminilitoris TaxID=1445613 RepID=UPI0004DF1774
MLVADVFEEHRGMLFGIAYRLLGSVADAEDIVQDAWLRWAKVTEPVEHPKAYLARTVTNLAINRLRSAAVTRESYVGPWLPEPLVTTPDATDGVELAESVSLAIMVVLESLSPLERAVFVLHEAFGFGYTEIAGMLDRSAASVRQLGHRAHEHVQARRPRYEPAEQQRKELTERFLNASAGGDIAEMMSVLAPDVTLVSDGGGKRRAALRPVLGADKVARFILGVWQKLPPSPVVSGVLVNGAPGILVSAGGEPDTVACFEVAAGLVTEINVIRNPDKLRHITAI